MSEGEEAEVEVKETPPPRIAAAYLFANGMVMVFDDAGQQVPELQGPKEEVFKRLMAAVDENTKLCGFDGMPVVWRCP